jgi:hypothetical protein
MSVYESELGNFRNPIPLIKKEEEFATEVTTMILPYAASLGAALA